MKLFMFYTGFTRPPHWIGEQPNPRAIYVYARSLSTAAALCEKNLNDHEVINQLTPLPNATMLFEQI